MHLNYNVSAKHHCGMSESVEFSVLLDTLLLLLLLRMNVIATLQSIDLKVQLQ